jgi:hypothetical protein
MDDNNAKESASNQRVIGRPFPPGVSGNPAGRPKGTVSIKESIRRYLRENPGEVDRLVQHFVKSDPGLMWQMLEGRPKQNVDMDVDKDSISELTTMFRAMAGVAIKTDDLPRPQGSDGVRAGQEAV